MIARKALIILFSNFIIAGFNFATYYFAVRAYLPRSFGYLAVANAIFGFFVFFADLNMTNVHVKHMSEKKYTTSEYFTVYFIIKIFLLGIVSIVIFAVIHLQIASGKIENNNLQNSIIIGIYLNSIFSSINLLYSSSFQAEFNVTKMQITILIGRIVQLILVFYVIFSGYSFIFYIITMIIGNVLTLILNIILGRKKYYLTKIKIEILKSYFSFGLITIIPQIFYLFVMNMGPLVFLNFYNSDLLSVYYILTNVFVSITIIRNSFQALMLPSFSPMIKSNQFKQISNSLATYEKYMLYFTSLLVIGNFFLGRYFIQLFFGSFYLEHGLEFFYFTIIYSVTWAILSPYALFIYISKSYGMYFLNYFIMLLSSIICWFTLIPSLNILALDLGKWIIFIPNAIIIRIYIRKKYNVGGLKKKNLLILLLLAIFSITSYLITSMFDKMIFSILITLLFLFIFTILLFSLKIFSKSDLRFILKTINIKDFINEAKEDF